MFSGTERIGGSYTAAIVWNGARSAGPRLSLTCSQPKLPAPRGCQPGVTANQESLLTWSHCQSVIEAESSGRHCDRIELRQLTGPCRVRALAPSRFQVVPQQRQGGSRQPTFSAFLLLPELPPFLRESSFPAARKAGRRCRHEPRFRRSCLCESVPGRQRFPGREQAFDRR